MAKYRKKPVVIEAEQFRNPRPWPKEGLPAVRGVCLCSVLTDGQVIDELGRGRPHVHTIHKGQVCFLEDGDWVLPEPDGFHFYPCKPAIFETTHERIEE
jgi:hypothetical protein